MSSIVIWVNHAFETILGFLCRKLHRNSASELHNSQPSLIQSEIEFGLNLLRQRNLTESFVFSPVSISFGLALVHAAASGKTRSQICEALLRGSSDKQLEQHLSNIYAEVTSIEEGKEVDVIIANHVFSLNGYPIKKKYLDTVSKLYNAGASSWDFGDKKESAEIINDFMSKSTEGHITDIINPEDIEENLIAVFVNSLHFKAIWLEKFDSKIPAKADFFSSPNLKRSIDFLCSTTHKFYANDDHFQMITLPYRDKSYAMNIFLPKLRLGLKEALIKLTSAGIQNLLTKSSEEWVEIKIPKWKIDSTIRLIETLQAIGIELSLDSKHQIFRKLADKIYGLSDVCHAAKIEVNENGTCVAAGSRIINRNGAIMPIPLEFTADHPFLFILTKDSHPLFIGLHY